MSRRPQLQLYRSLWGVGKANSKLLSHLRSQKYAGIEASLPDLGSTRQERQAAAQLIHDHGMKCIIGIYSSWQDYEDDRSDHYKASTHHVQRLEKQLREARDLGAHHVNAHSGCDAWEEEGQVVPFFESVLDTQARILGSTPPDQRIGISHETHRGRPLGDPFVADRLLSKLPDLSLTADLSHWILICERLLGSGEVGKEKALLQHVAQKTRHVHARIGTPQAPQIRDPRDEQSSPYNKAAIQAHMNFWKMVQEAHVSRGYQVWTMTPEYGPSPYTPTLPYTGKPVSDVLEITEVASSQLRQAFR